MGIIIPNAPFCFTVSVVDPESLPSILPKEPRALLKTSTYYNVIDIDGGSNYHFGLVSSLLK